MGQNQEAERTGSGEDSQALFRGKATALDWSAPLMSMLFRCWLRTRTFFSGTVRIGCLLNLSGCGLRVSSLGSLATRECCLKTIGEQCMYTNLYVLRV